MTIPRLVAAALLLLAAAFAAADATPAAARVLRIGLADDPDMLDPTRLSGGQQRGRQGWQ